MTQTNRPRHATRLNAFKGGGGVRGMIVRAGSVGGRSAADRDFPDHGGLDPVAGARATLALTGRLRGVARVLSDNPRLCEAQARHDAAAMLRAVSQVLYGD